MFGFSHPYRGYNKTLDQFSEWLVAQRSAGWEVADLHSGMARWLAEQRQRDPDFNYTKDGVHPDGGGHWVMAQQILLYLGAKDVENAASAPAMLKGEPSEIMRLVRRKQQLLRDAWLSEVGHTRPGLKAGLPLNDAQAKAAELDKQLRELVKRNSAATRKTP
jgi:hypothetical protein